jgi:alpha-D-xyloside xylohydrolase
VYARLYNQCVFEATQRYAEGNPMIWSRAGWTGSQLFPIGWGGDPQSDWEGLAASIRGGQAWGVSGVPFYAHDIGGWYGNLKDPELFVRWTQAGVMSSHMRFHGTGPREPWIFGTKIEKIVTDWINWRYQLIPYLRLCEYEAHLNGMPVMRSMALAFPDDKASWSFEEQYLLGPSLLVAPITQAGGYADVYLPKGTWYNIWNGERIDGGRVLNLKNIPLEEIPIFGREGYWLPLGPVVESTDRLKGDDVINEVWTFGEPLLSFSMQTEKIKAQTIDGRVILSTPIDFKVTKF